jgi:hypothetical protein
MTPAKMAPRVPGRAGLALLSLLALLGLLAMHATPAMLPGTGQPAATSSFTQVGSMILAARSSMDVAASPAPGQASSAQPRQAPMPAPHHMLRPCVSDSTRRVFAAALHGATPAIQCWRLLPAFEAGCSSAPLARAPTPTPNLTKLCISQT